MVVHDEDKFGYESFFTTLDKAIRWVESQCDTKVDKEKMAAQKGRWDYQWHEHFIIRRLVFDEDEINDDS